MEAQLGRGGDHLTAAWRPRECGGQAGSGGVAGEGSRRAVAGDSDLLASSEVQGAVSPSRTEGRGCCEELEAEKVSEVTGGGFGERGPCLAAVGADAWPRTRSRGLSGVAAGRTRGLGSCGLAAVCTFPQQELGPAQERRSRVGRAS